jgi:hypothetical protein
LGRPRSGNARCVAGLAGGRVAPGCGCLWARRARRRGTSQSGCGDRRAKASRRSIRNHALFFPKILYKNIFFLRNVKTASKTVCYLYMNSRLVQTSSESRWITTTWIPSVISCKQLVCCHRHLRYFIQRKELGNSLIS